MDGSTKCAALSQETAVRFLPIVSFNHYYSGNQVVILVTKPERGTYFNSNHDISSTLPKSF